MKVSFSGLNSNIKNGRFAIRQIRESYPFGFVSNTWYEAFASKVHPEMDTFLCDKIKVTRDKIDFEKRLGYDNLTAVENIVKETGAANCGEQAYLLSKRLKENGVKHKVVVMEMKKGDSYVDSHTFCVIGLDEKSQINNPKTWGKNAVVADLWMNSVDRASKALNKILNVMDFKKKENTITFREPYIF